MMRKLENYTPTRFMAPDSHYDKAAADYAVDFIQCLRHNSGVWAGQPFELIDWQEQIIRDLFGILKPNGYRQFNMAYIEVPKKTANSLLWTRRFLLRPVLQQWENSQLATLSTMIRVIRATLSPRVLWTTPSRHIL